MNTYNIAYFNWADKQIQFTEEDAESGLEAMKALSGLSSLDKILDEEVFFEQVYKRGGFITYEQV